MVATDDVGRVDGRQSKEVVEMSWSKIQQGRSPGTGLCTDDRMTEESIARCLRVKMDFFVDDAHGRDGP